MGNHEQTSTEVGESQQTTTEPTDPWESMKSDFRAVRFLKNAVRLLAIQHKANEMETEYKADINSLRSRKTQALSRLEQLAQEQQIEEFNNRISTIKRGLAAIDKRVAKLLPGEDKGSKPGT